jgi:transcriptional regulator with XRE-family HTH domain
MMQGSLAEKLRVLRARIGLSLTEAAARAGVTRDTLSDLEHGKRHPYMPTLSKIATGYGVPVEDLLEEPALAEKAEAPEETGPSLLDKGLDAARRDEERNAKALRRLFASEGVLQGTNVVGSEEDRFRAELRELGLPDEFFETLIWPLVTELRQAKQKVVQVEKENARLRADLAKVKA